MIGADLVGAVRADQQHRRIGQRSVQVQHQVPGGRVGPVQVLDHHRDRAPGRRDGLGHPPELASPIPGTSARQGRWERLNEWCVRNVGLKLQAAAGQHGRPGLDRLLGERLHQAGLADPRVALDQHQPAAARGGFAQVAEQGGELGSPADQLRNRNPPRHGDEYRSRAAEIRRSASNLRLCPML
jgi:hypothetical protein